MKFSLGTLAAVALAGSIGFSAAQAAEPDDAIKYRKSVMEVVGGHTGAFFAILQGKVDHPDALLYHAKGIADASNHAPAAFEQNTAGQGDEKTTAKDDIWADGSDFGEDMDDFKTAAVALATAVESGDMAAIGPAAGALGNACKHCHDDFRTK